jgi:hypothetical protein
MSWFDPAWIARMRTSRGGEINFGKEGPQGGESLGQKECGDDGMYGGWG